MVKVNINFYFLFFNIQLLLKMRTLKQKQMKVMKDTGT